MADRKKYDCGYGKRKRLQILAFIREYMLENRYPPTVREICEGVGLLSTASVFSHLKILISEGKVTMREGEPRTVVPSDIRVIIADDEKDVEKNRD